MLSMTVTRAPKSGPPDSGLAPPGAEDTRAIDRAMDRYADGDDDAFDAVFRGLSGRIHAFLRRMSGRQDVAEDLTQETFLRIHRARSSFARGRGAVPWAYAIARNCYLDHVRSQRRAQPMDDVDLVEPPTGPEASAEEEVAAKQSAATVRRVLLEMNDSRREAFILLRYEGLSVAAAAEVLGTSQGAVKARAFHAYELLRAALGKR